MKHCFEYQFQDAWEIVVSGGGNDIGGLKKLTVKLSSLTDVYQANLLG